MKRTNLNQAFNECVRYVRIHTYIQSHKHKDRAHDLLLHPFNGAKSGKKTD